MAPMHPGPSDVPADAPSPAPPVRLKVRADRLGVMVERPDDGEAVRCDADGRWVSYHPRGSTLRRALDGSVHRRRDDGDEPVEGAAEDAVHEAAARTAAGFAAALDAGAAADVVGDRGLAVALLATAAGRGAAWYREEAARARAVWPDGVPILPPHRYRDVVVDPARGCPNGGCSFCAFYRDRPFRPLDDAAFAAHLDAVVAHGGRSLDAVDGVFLGSASAASLPDPTLLRRLADVEARLGRRRRGVAAFLDPDHAPRRDAAAWAALRSTGLEDVTVGLETAVPSLREAVGKRGDVVRFAADVAALKAGGLRVAVTVLLGLGGPARAAAHLEATTAFVAALPLDARDLVYLSALRAEVPRAAEAAEVARWRAALAGRTPARATPYPAETFVARA